MRSNSIKHLITQGMGYCCEYIFFSNFLNTELIANRLGVTERAVRRHKAAFLADELRCSNCSNCMKEKLK